MIRKLTDEMKVTFYERTYEHIWRVQKWSGLIESVNFPEIDNITLCIESKKHDQSKFQAPELDPYILITARYKYPAIILSEVEKQQCLLATYHHIKTNKHHPEYWDNSTKLDCLNTQDRDLPAKPVNAEKMPLTYVACMLADWLAMSEELGTSAHVWADRTIGIRWFFSNYQINFIYKVLDLVDQLLAPRKGGL